MKYLPIIVILVALFSTGGAIKCYQCSDPPTSDCADPFSEGSNVEEASFSIDCHCVKAVLKISNDTTSTYRSCVDIDGMLGPSFSRAGDFIESVETHFCDTDLCNGANTYTVALPTLIGVLALLAVANWS